MSPTLKYIGAAIVTIAALIAGGHYAQHKRDVAQFHTLQAQADKGDVNAQYEVALRFEQGRGTVRSYAQAGYYYNRAAYQGHQASKDRIRKADEICDRHSVTTLEDAHECQLDAESGDTNAQIQVGVMYMQGHFLKKEPVYAVPYFNLAAIHGDTRGQMMMSVIYSGKVFPFNPIESFAWAAVTAQRKDLPDEQKAGSALLLKNLRTIIVRDFGQQTMDRADEKARFYIEKYGSVYTADKGGTLDDPRSK